MWAPPSTPSPPPCPGRGQCCQVWALRPGGKRSLESSLSSMPHSGLEGRAGRAPRPTYLVGERKEQQQRAGGRGHRAQRVLLQPQHVHKAPLAGHPQPGQHLRRGRETRRPGSGEADTLLKAWEESPPGPPPRRGDDTATKRGPHVAPAKPQQPRPRGPGHALGSSALSSLGGCSLLLLHLYPPRPPCRGPGRAQPGSSEPTGRR